MFSLIKQVFIVLSSFSSSLSRVANSSDRIKCLPLNDQLCMVRSTLIDLNPVEIKYYPFMISLDKYAGSCNALSPKVCAPKETKDINVKLFNMITNKNEAKTMAKHISCDCKCKSNSTTCNFNQKLNNKTCQCECKNCRTCKKDCSWYSSDCTCENNKYLKNIADISFIAYDKVISIIDIASTEMANTIPRNVTSTILTTSDSVKVLLLMILQFIITIICYH